LLVFVVACGGGGGGSSDDDDDDETPSIDAGVDATPAPDCLRPALACPAGAPPVGSAGGYKVDSFPLSWTYCAEAEAAVAEPVYFNVPADVLSFSMTVETGVVEAGLVLVTLDGDELINLDSLGKPPFRHFPGVAPSVVLPISPNTFPQGPFCVAAVPVLAAQENGALGALHVMTRRDGGGMGRFDMNVVMSDAVKADQADIEAAVALVADIYFDGNAASLQSVDYYTVRAAQPGGGYRPTSVQHLRRRGLHRHRPVRHGRGRARPQRRERDAQIGRGGGHVRPSLQRRQRRRRGAGRDDRPRARPPDRPLPHERGQRPGARQLL
jgi:hypothetical protein